MQIVTTRNKKMKLCKMIVRDNTDACEITWYNQQYLKNQFHMGEEYSFFGKISKKSGHIEMLSPVFDKEGIKNNTRKNYTNLSTNIQNISKSNEKSYRKWIETCKWEIRRIFT